MVMKWILAAMICSVLMPATVFARAWRDQKGNIINADFVKIEGGMIYLKPENKYAAATPFPFYDFSEADQDFLRGILKKKGQEDRIPPRPKDDRNNKPSQPSAVPINVIPNAGFKPSDTIPDIPDANSKPAPSVPIAVTPTVPPNATPLVNPAPTVPPNTSPPASSSSNPNLRLHRGADGRATIFPNAEEKQCMQCGRPVRGSSKAGDRCPHCFARWDVEVDESGKTTATAPGVSANDWMYSRGAIRLAFLVGAFVIGGIAKIVHDNK